MRRREFRCSSAHGSIPVHSHYHGSSNVDYGALMLTTYLTRWMKEIHRVDIMHLVVSPKLLSFWIVLGPLVVERTHGPQLAVRTLATL